MCVIVVVGDKEIKFSDFKNCWTSNSDGFGLAYQDGGMTYVEKGKMTLESAWDCYNRSPKTGVVLHFRIATEGGVSRELTHPFLLSKSGSNPLRCRTNSPVLFHNGIISGWETMLAVANSYTGKTQKGPMSDSRALAVTLSAVKDKNTGKILGKNTSSKFVLLTQREIKLFGNFVEHDGSMYSNRSFDRYTYARICDNDMYLSSNLFGYGTRLHHMDGCMCSDCIEEKLDRAERVIADTPRKRRDLAIIHDMSTINGEHKMETLIIDPAGAAGHVESCACDLCLGSFLDNNEEMCRECDTKRWVDCLGCISRRKKKALDELKKGNKAVEVR